MENFTKLNPKSNLPTSVKVVWSGIKDNGLDLYFYVQDAHTNEWHNLFFNPDSISQNEIAAHEEYLKRSSHYAARDLDAFRRLLVNTSTIELIPSMTVYSNDSDGGVMNRKT